MRKTALIVVLIMVASVASFWPSQDKQFTVVPLSVRASYDHSMHYLVPKAAKAVEQLVADAELDGMCLTVISSHRTFGRQQYLYDTIKDKSRVAKPGTSQHELGTAVDFEACATVNGFRDDTAEREEIKGDFDRLPEYEWLKENAGKYGFTESYPKDNTLGFMYEPWHWNYENTAH